MTSSDSANEEPSPGVTQEDRDRAAEWYPHQTFTDDDLKMMKALGHL